MSERSEANHHHGERLAASGETLVSVEVTSSTGRVVAFDESTGLGTIEAGDRTSVPFHCVEIADGSRAIAVGTPVTFGTTVKLGAVEATAVTERPA